MFQSSQFGLALGHHHGGDEWHEMYEVDPHDSAETDPERLWPNGRIFRCSACQDEVRVQLPNEEVERPITE